MDTSKYELSNYPTSSKKQNILTKLARFFPAKQPSDPSIEQWEWKYKSENHYVSRDKLTDLGFGNRDEDKYRKREEFMNQIQQLADNQQRYIDVYTSDGKDSDKTFLFRSEPGKTMAERIARMEQVTTAMPSIFTLDKNVSEVFLFGSLAKKNPLARDIDLAIIVEEFLRFRSSYKSETPFISFTFPPPRTLELPADHVSDYLNKTTVSKLAELAAASYVPIHGVIIPHNHIATPSDRSITLIKEVMTDGRTLYKKI